jgi:hypothetical protein
MKWVAEIAIALAMLGVGIYEISHSLIKMKSVATSIASTDGSHDE